MPAGAQRSDSFLSAPTCALRSVPLCDHPTRAPTPDQSVFIPFHYDFIVPHRPQVAWSMCLSGTSG